MYAMIKGLLMAGISVKVFALNTNKYTVDLKDIPGQFKQQTNISFVSINITINPGDAFLNLFTHQSYHVKRFISSDIAAALTEILKVETFDVIQFESLFLTPYINLIKRYSSARLVLRAHNIEHLIWFRLAQDTTSPLKRWYLNHLAKTLRSYELSVMNELDGIAAITDIDEERFRRLGCKIFIGTIPFSIACPEVIPQKNTILPKTIFHIGSMNWLPNQKGIRWFLKECWPLVREKLPEVSLVLAGREMPDWLLHTDMTGVEIRGEVVDAAQFMCENGIMIVPLFSGSGVRVKILEAMALGKTVITTSIGAEGIKCQHKKNILIADTSTDFANAIISCYTEPGMAEQIGINARLYIQEYHLMEKVSRMTKNFYQQLIQSLNE